MAGSTPTGAGRGLGGASGGRGAPRAGSRSAAPPAPRSSSRTGGSCTPTASGSAGPRSCSTSPACCRSCRSSGLGGDRGGLSGLPCLSSPACPLGGLSDQSPRWLAENRPAQSVSEPLWFNGPSWCPDSNLWVRVGLVPGDMGCSRKGPVVKLCERTSLLGLQLEPLGLVTGH